MRQHQNSRDAKRDERLRNSGKLIYFQYGTRRFELIPYTYFYNWLYINTLSLHQDLCDKIIEYTAFTDIEFNPQKSFITLEEKERVMHYKAELIYNTPDEFLTQLKKYEDENIVLINKYNDLSYELREVNKERSD